MRPLWFSTIMRKTFPQRFLLAKLSNIPIIGKIMKYLIFEGVDIIYLPKDKVIEVNSTLEPSDMVLPTQIIKSFVEKSKYRFIMNTCLCREASKCKDYPIDLGCIFLGDSVLDINPGLGRMVSKGEAFNHIKRGQEAGLVHMIGIDKLDSMWLNVDEEKLLSICACDPCCCLWKMCPDLRIDLGAKIKKMPGVEVIVNRELCIGCGKCGDGVCFVEAINVVNEKAEINKECKGCGRCVEICPQKAIVLTINNNEFIEKSIEQISSLIDVT